MSEIEIESFTWQAPLICSVDAPVSRTRDGPSLKGCMVYGGEEKERILTKVSIEL